MAIVLYREGSTHTIRGVVCEAKRFDPDELDWCLGEGWYKSPHDMTPAIIEEIEKPDELADYSADEIRQLAKEADIIDYDKKRIKTLKIELRYEPED